MEQFLRVVAEGYKKRYPDFSKITFVMPNKRSGSFLLKKIKELSEKSILSPRIVTITDFVADSIDYVSDSRIDLLFRLYRSYRKLQSKDADITFEKFSSWGETLLSDFNEVDMQMVNVEELFENITDLNKIRSEFLTDEQKAVMVEYFGHSPEILDIRSEKLWKNFDSVKVGDTEHGNLREKFVSLWQILLPLYNDFKENLLESGLTTTGGAYRLAAEKIENGYEPYSGDKIVFVGFNALAESERRIFRALRDSTIDVGIGEEPKADFVWDNVSPVFAVEDDPASRYITINSRKGNFPAPDWLWPWLQKAVPAESPEIEVISVPSNVMQVKVAAQELEAIHSSIPEEAINNARVAVVLPDENLLLPLLYSLPKAYPNPNLTMGFPLRHTAVISFVSLLKRLHRRSREKDGKAEFLFEDVKDILGHPYSFILFSRFNIRELIRECEKKKLFVVSTDTLAILGENSGLLFRFIGGDVAPSDVVEYIHGILSAVEKGMVAQNDTYIRSKVEKTYIETYVDALLRLDICMKENNMIVEPASVFQLADRLIAGETVAFEGEPLKGLQVMGVLETRCLDFDRIIMLSVNEKMMPRVGRNSTFIPNFMRGAYGMPPANYQEELFAYYFYRVLGRCTKGVLTYDSRSSDVRTAGPSRYLLQMKYLSDKVNIKEREKQFGMPGRKDSELIFPKTGELLEKTKRFEIGSEWADNLGERKFSATALSHYFACQARFMFNNVLELYIEREKIESIDAIDLGTIVHGAIERLYIRNEKDREKMLAEPIVMTHERLKALLDERTPRGELLIEKMAREMILKTHFGLTDEKEIERGELRGSAAIIFEYIVNYIRNIILADMRQAPFRIWGCEIEETVSYPLPDGSTVKMKMVVDRLDQAGEAGYGPFRVVDYKTGKVKLSAPDIAGIFSDSLDGKNIFQIIFYAKLFILMVEQGEIRLPEGVDKEDFKNNLEFVIYDVPNILEYNPESKGAPKGVVMPRVHGVTISSMKELSQLEEAEGRTFTEIMDEKLMEILDPSHPYKAMPSESTCEYCDYRLRCELYGAKQREETAE